MVNLSFHSTPQLNAALNRMAKLSLTNEQNIGRERICLNWMKDGKFMKPREFGSFERD